MEKGALYIGVFALKRKCHPTLEHIGGAYRAGAQPQWKGYHMNGAGRPEGVLSLWF